MKEKIFKLIPVALLVIVGLVLRLWGIWHGSFAFTYDTGRDLLAVRDFVLSHKFSLIGPTSGQMGIFYGPWWYWFLALPFIIFSGNPAGIASFIALFGVLATVLAFWWGKQFRDEYFGFSLATIIAVSPFFVSATTQIWSPDLLIWETLLVIILFSKIEKLNSWQLILFGFLLALLTEMEIVFGVVFAVSMFLVLFVWERKFLFSQKIIILLTGGILVELPRIIFELRHNLLQTRALLRIWENKENYAFHLDTRIRIIWEKWLSVIPNNNTYIAFVITAIALFLFFMAFKKVTKQEKKFYLKLITIAIIFIMITIMYPREFWDYYLLGLPVIFAIFIAVVFSFLTKIFPKKFVWLALIFYVVLLAKPNEILAVIKNPQFIGNAAVFRNQIRVIDYVYDQAGGKDFNYIAYTPPQIEYTWRYLFWWYGRTKYGHEPVIRRQERFYVIIEPDPGYEDRITMWFKIRENDGKVVKEYTLPSGIMVQTRLRPKE